MKSWGHDQLANDLAAHLCADRRSMVWANIPMGPAGSVRPDVFCMKTSFTKPLPTTYEVKVSASDFRSDVSAGKWQAYLRFSGAVIFAAPKGLISRDDLPKGCGLILRNEKGWRTLRAPTRQPVELETHVFLKLLMRPGFQREGQTWNRADEWTARRRAIKAVGDRLGKEIGEYLSNKDYALSKLERIKEEAAQREERSKEAARVLQEDGVRLLRDCCEALGLPEQSTPRRIRYAVEDALRRLRNQDSVQLLKRQVEQLTDAFDRLKANDLLQDSAPREAAE